MSLIHPPRLAAVLKPPVERPKKENCAGDVKHERNYFV